MPRFSPANTLTMQQLTRDNHYVPQWYQRGFLSKGQHKLHVLNLRPAAKSLPTGKTLVDPISKSSARSWLSWNAISTRRVSVAC
jgi:hypothetical protein